MPVSLMVTFWAQFAQSQHRRNGGSEQVRPEQEGI